MTVNARTIALALATSGFFDAESPGEKRATALKFQRPPQPAKRLTDADLNRIEAAEAKRQRRIERNKQRGDV
jgi:hypothetical protein